MASQLRRELAPCVASVGLVALVRERLPHVVSAGDLLLLGAAALLLQGLARDLGRLAAARRSPSRSRAVTCVCVESTVGVVAIVAGAALALGWATVRVKLAPVVWPASLAAVLAFGAMTRDFVLDWREGRVRRETDHGARVRWRS